MRKGQYTYENAIKREIIILLVILLVGILSFAIINLTKTNANEVIVQVNNQVGRNL